MIELLARFLERDTMQPQCTRCRIDNVLSDEVWLCGDYRRVFVVPILLVTAKMNVYFVLTDTSSLRSASLVFPVLFRLP